VSGGVDEIDGRIDDLMDRIRQLREAGQLRSSLRLTRELKRLARTEQRLIPYLLANFYLMNDSRSQLVPEEGIEAAIETISLLESEDRARAFQPEFPLAEYVHTVGWMSTCAYDNLAENIGLRDGYNSPGMHDCINDGLTVCRRTGKLECITCFREYATDVYLAADDFDMALHHARYVAGHRSTEPNTDRRWGGYERIAAMEILRGNLDAALVANTEAFAVVGESYDPLNARRMLVAQLETILALMGRDDRLSELLLKAGIPEDFERVPEAGENLRLDLTCKLRETTRLVCDGDFLTALRELSSWDRLLQSQRCVELWFEVRLRIIATYLLSGQTERANTLIPPLEARARAAHDWSTLRRLAALSDPAGVVSPVAAVATSQRDASRSPRDPGRQISPADPIQGPGDSSTSQSATSEPLDDGLGNVPLAPVADLESRSSSLTGLADRLRSSSGDVAALGSLLDDLITRVREPIESARDAAWLAHLTHLCARILERERDGWTAIRPAVDRFLGDAVVMNVMADLGRSVRERCPSDADALVPAEQIDEWFRVSLELEPSHGRNFARAGDYYLSVNRPGEAERCFARAFRLDRSDAHLALRLSELYQQSDRPRDAVAVLDMAIREGASDPTLFWQAGILALSVDRYDSAVSYFVKFEELQPGEPWTQYYRALALLESNRPGLGLAAIDLEAQRSPDHRLPVAILRAWAFSLLADQARLAEQLGLALRERLAEVDYLTEAGLARLFDRLYRAACMLAPKTELRDNVERLLVATGLAPEALFEADRAKRDSIDDLGFYVAVVHQPLGADWPTSIGCLAGQHDWSAYRAAWGVLARDDEEAGAIALTWQARIGSLSPRLVEVQPQGGSYRDAPGVVWQGLHQSIEPDTSV
jgi:tetratricopeptide (TPR) repeat protein